ncbi:MAG: transaldolase [Clostridiaceae bacterium]|nr:transaldolase [Clostridiaceae bacterium]
MKYQELKIKIFADGADLKDMLDAYHKGLVKGFTTNPSLMKKAGITDYKEFAKKVLENIKDMPVSFEVFSDDFESMEKEAEVLAALGDNVYIKIPVTNTKGESSVPLIKKLSNKGYHLNVTAIFTLEQIKDVAAALKPGVKSIISVFAGRIADTGENPVEIMKEASSICKNTEGAELLWASCRELYNIVEADECGCQIITVTNDVLKKIPSMGKSLVEYSLETVRGFYKDASSLGFSII